MIRSQLNSYSGNDPIWGFVALVGAERFSGEAAVGLDPRIRLFAADGQVYYAEREGDAEVGTRLVNCGAITAEQLAAGSVRVGDTVSLARLFQRQPLIDRDAVELTIQHATEALLESVAHRPVAMPEVFPLRHHPAGLHHWLRSSAPAPAVPIAPDADAPVATAAAVVAPPIEIPAPLPPAAPPMVEPRFVEPLTRPVAEAPAELAEPVSTASLVTAFVPLDLAPMTPEPEPVVAAEPEPQPVVAPEPEPVVAAEPEPELVIAAEPEPVVEAPAARLEPLPMLGLTQQLRSQPARALEPAVIAVEPAVEPEPIDEPLVQPEPAAPAFAPLSPMAATSAPAPVGVPSFDDLDAVLAGSRTDFPTTELPAIDPAAMAELTDLAPLSSLAFLSSVGEAPASPPYHVLPSLASGPGSVASFATANAADLAASTPPPSAPAPAAGLPRLASAPISVDDYDSNATPVADAAHAGGAPTHTLAAVEIWELVDDLMTDPSPGGATSGQDDASERQGRGWRRGRKS